MDKYEPTNKDLARAGLNDIFGETLPQRVFWISLWAIMTSAVISGVWLFVRILEEFGKLI